MNINDIEVGNTYRIDAIDATTGYDWIAVSLDRDRAGNDYVTMKNKKTGQRRYIDPVNIIGDEQMKRKGLVSRSTEQIATFGSVTMWVEEIVFCSYKWT